MGWGEQYEPSLEAKIELIGEAIRGLMLERYSDTDGEPEPWLVDIDPFVDDVIDIISAHLISNQNQEVHPS